MRPARLCPQRSVSNFSQLPHHSGALHLCEGGRRFLECPPAGQPRSDHPLGFPQERRDGTYRQFCACDDSDVYKVIEGAAYSLQTYPDKRLERYVDSLITLIVAAQEADGYLYTARTCNPTKIHPGTGKTRWEGEEGGSHELYCFGHLAEAAVAYWQATGKRALLDATIRFADCICREVGPNPGQAMVIPVIRALNWPW